MLKSRSAAPVFRLKMTFYAEAKRESFENKSYMHPLTIDTVARFAEEALNTPDRMTDAGDDEFDLAGRKIFLELGLDPDTAAPSELDSANMVYRAPGGGALYVGDQRAAR